MEGLGEVEEEKCEALHLCHSSVLHRALHRKESPPHPDKQTNKPSSGHMPRLPIRKWQRGTSEKFYAFYEVCFVLCFTAFQGRRLLRSSFVTCPLRLTMSNPNSRVANRTISICISISISISISITISTSIYIYMATAPSVTHVCPKSRFFPSLIVKMAPKKGK